MSLPQLTTQQAIVLLDALEAIAHDIVENHGADIERFYLSPHDDLDTGEQETPQRHAPQTRSSSPEDDIPF